MPKYETRDMFYCNDFGSKARLVMKFSHFMSYYKKKILSKNLSKNVAWKLVPSPFAFITNREKILLENDIFETS